MTRGRGSQRAACLSSASPPHRRLGGRKDGGAETEAQLPPLPPGPAKGGAAGRRSTWGPLCHGPRGAEALCTAGCWRDPAITFPFLGDTPSSLILEWPLSLGWGREEGVLGSRGEVDSCIRLTIIPPCCARPKSAQSAQLTRRGASLWREVGDPRART